ncbi:hypothetical protein PENSPDRAFT_683893 [Peniophora sp. CONT]|nr:hypothetical protein PENSPDRAFT_683893 [Peniophora sp. CONT]
MAFRTDNVRPHRRVSLQLSLHRYFTSPRRTCYINQLPLEILVEILVHVSNDTENHEKLHCDPFKLPNTHWSKREDVDDSTWWLFGPSNVRCIADLYYRDGCSHFCHSMPWNWLEVTRVCKLWHCAAHSSAEFWSRIPLQTKDALSRSLQLSGALPLRLIVHFDRRWQVYDSLKRSFEQLHRIGEISLTGQTLYTCDWDNVSAWLCKPAPNLRRLHLSTYNLYDRFHSDLFGNQKPPKLQEVELIGFRVPKIHHCSTLLPQTLTSLVLTRCWLRTWDDSPNHSGSTLFNALGMMPLLETLSITNSELPPHLTEVDGSSLPTKPLAFPHMRRITFEANLRAVYRLLTNIELPTTAGLTLLIKYNASGIKDDPTIDVQKFLSVFKKQLGDAARNGAYYAQTTLNFDMDPDDQGSRHAFYTFIHPRHSGSHLLPERVEFRHYIDPNSFEFADEVCSFANSLCELVPHNGADVSLEVCQLCPFEDSNSKVDDWLRCVADMDGLSQLRLRCDAGLEFLSWLIGSGALLDQDAQDKPSTSTTARYPRLRSLELAEECYITRDDQDAESVLPHILKLLEHHLFGVTVKGCFGDAVARKKLHKLLGKRLRWDWRENWMANAGGDTMDCFPGMHPPIQIIHLN